MSFKLPWEFPSLRCVNWIKRIGSCSVLIAIALAGGCAASRDSAKSYVASRPPIVREARRIGAEMLTPPLLSEAARAEVHRRLTVMLEAECAEGRVERVGFRTLRYANAYTSGGDLALAFADCVAG